MRSKKSLLKIKNNYVALKRSVIDHHHSQTEHYQPNLKVLTSLIVLSYKKSCLVLANA